MAEDKYVTRKEFDEYRKAEEKIDGLNIKNLEDKIDGILKHLADLSKTMKSLVTKLDSLPSKQDVDDKIKIHKGECHKELVPLIKETVENYLATEYKKKGEGITTDLIKDAIKWILVLAAGGLTTYFTIG